MKVLIGTINDSLWFDWMKDKDQPLQIQGKTRRRGHTLVGTPKGTSTGELLLWYKMVAVHCFVWPHAAL